MMVKERDLKIVGHSVILSSKEEKEFITAFDDVDFLVERGCFIQFAEK